MLDNVGVNSGTDGGCVGSTSAPRRSLNPGGSVRDADVIAAADEQNLARVFTGRRHFRH